jgi:glycosyltransferase involved in cell wall biosynthesis
LNPKVSIIIPSYNRADMILTAIESAQAQTFPNWEVIIVDDGSVDNTREVVAGVKDARVRYIYQDNKGLSGARNTGIRASRGEYIAFLDSDDAFSPKKLELQVPVLDSNLDLGLVAAGFHEVDVKLQFIRELRPWEKSPILDLLNWVRTCPFCPGAPLVRRTWLEKAGLFDESMRFVEDWDLWLRMSFLGCRMQWLEEPVYLYRMHNNNMVRQAMLMKNGMIRMFDKFFAQPGLPDQITALHDEAYGHAYLNAAARALAGGDGEEGKACLITAFEYDPSLLKGFPPVAIDSLASFALTPLCPDARQFMELLAVSLPKALEGWPRRRLLAALDAVEAFEKAAMKKSGVFRCALKAAWNDPSWLRNRGFILLALHHSLFGWLRLGQKDGFSDLHMKRRAGVNWRVQV